MSEGEKVKLSVMLPRSFTNGTVEQLEQPQLVRFSFGEGGCLVEEARINLIT